jgi:hypothetical protein
MNTKLHRAMTERFCFTFTEIYIMHILFWSILSIENFDTKKFESFVQTNQKKLKFKCKFSLNSFEKSVLKNFKSCF